MINPFARDEKIDIPDETLVSSALEGDRDALEKF